MVRVERAPNLAAFDAGGSRASQAQVREPTPADRLSEKVKNAMLALVLGGALFVALGDYHQRGRGSLTKQYRGHRNMSRAAESEAAGRAVLGAGTVWNMKPDPMGELCAPVVQLLMENEGSGLPPLKGIAIGYPAKPGINGLGDRIMALAGAAMVAMALGRPFRMYLKADVWNVTG